jgi:hypothetical protein
MTTSFHTDNAAPCWSCQGTVATYTVDNFTTLVDVFCHGCHRNDLFTYLTTEPTAAILSDAHRRQQR